MEEKLPEKWSRFLAGTPAAEAWRKPLACCEARRGESTVFPPAGKIFHAFEATPPESVRAVILGQDPYHEDGQAEGLAFSVPEGVKPPPSLRNIFREYAADLGRPLSAGGSLLHWAAGGILLLNSILSVDAHRPGSHAAFGWEEFTDAVIAALSERRERCVFILWGGAAIRKAPLIDSGKHLILCSAHPSPFSAYRGFFGSRPFSQAEIFLAPWRWPEK